MSDHQLPSANGADKLRERTFKVNMLARVEGEGRFTLRVRDGKVVESKLAIFESPRFFEGFLRGRSLYEVPDITARICGICPVAYQTSSTLAMENALGIKLTKQIRLLRRLMYCAEWIESHALHIYLLHAPDFLGYPSAIAMAADHKELVEQGLRLKKLGNDLLDLIGGRSVHPISVRVGGFTKVPTNEALKALRPRLEQGLEEAIATVEVTKGLPMPEFDQEYTFMSLRCAEAYPIERGDGITISGRGEFTLEEFEEQVEESHEKHANALHARLRDGTPYLTGPLARLNLFAEQIHPTAAKALSDSGLRLPVTNPYNSIIVRAVELVHAIAESIDLIDAYSEPKRPFIKGKHRDAEGCGGSEAPRGLLWHRYRVGADGLIQQARIVPPTSQNQARIEEDLRGIAPQLLKIRHEDATLRCEQLIRCYDPCISCATHFLKLEIEEA